LVTVAVPRSVQDTVASFEPSLMTIGLGDPLCDELGQVFEQQLCEFAEPMTCVAVGPGLGSGAGTMRLVQSLYHRLTQPLVVDADGLNALATWPEGLKNPAGLRILTPHPGEFQPLAGEVCDADPTKRAEQAARLCHRDPSGRTLVVLKGHRTLITDGQRVSFNQTGNPGMATGGSGDVLTGVIAALVGQGLEPWQAARLGVHVHGLAGDLAATELGQISLIASDLLAYLSAAFQANH
jgi:NAD(P)H-hydrate epimerase